MQNTKVGNNYDMAKSMYSLIFPKKVQNYTKAKKNWKHKKFLNSVKDLSNQMAASYPDHVAKKNPWKSPEIHGLKRTKFNSRTVETK